MIEVNDRLRISGQPDGKRLEAAARKGVRLVINNRPDGEEAGQPMAAEQRALARRFGMDHVHIPVAPGSVDLDAVRRFQQALADAEGPVLAHCRTGTRSLTLHAIGEAVDGRLDAKGLRELEERTGIDLSGARNWLNANGFQA